MTEKNIQNAISDYLAVKKIVHWRQNSGAMTIDGNKKIRFIRFLYWLWPKTKYPFLDIAGILPSGKYFACEVKAPGKKPTTEQWQTINFINFETNAKAIWANSIDMFIEKFESIII
jgi:hypothetical protein